MIIQAIPLGMFSSDYEVEIPGTGICRIERPVFALRHKADLCLPGETFAVKSVGVGPKGYVLTDQSGNVALTAERKGFFSNSFTVKFDQREVEMKRKFWSLHGIFDLLEDNVFIGSVRSSGTFTRKTEIETEMDLPPAALLFFLFMGIETRAAMSSDSSSTSSST